MATNEQRRLFGMGAIAVQALLFLFFLLFTTYSNDLGSGLEDCGTLVDSSLCSNTTGCTYDVSNGVCVGSDGGVAGYYPFFQDVHVMIFIGFGFLMTFLHRYSFSALGVNFFIGAICIQLIKPILLCLFPYWLQWSIFTNAFWHNVVEDKWTGKLELNIVSLITGDFAAGAALITFGALLGKTTPLQMLFIVLLEMLFYSLNESICVVDYQAVDMGGSMYVHTFGAYFGLAVSYALGNKGRDGKFYRDHRHNKSSKTSDTFAMVGTLFLWMFWPSFNGALAVGASQHRVVVNTVLSLAACCISAFAFSNLMRPHYKFDMVDIQNATLAGGVAVGSSADLVIQPWGAILIGFLAGMISVAGYIKLTPMLDKWGLHDTCGVHNLHGMPGIVGGLGGAISAAIASTNEYGQDIGEIFPARGGGDPRSAGDQGLFQLAAVGTTLAFSIGGGIIVGKLCKNIFAQSEEPFVDDEFWEVPEEEEAMLPQKDTASSTTMV